MHCYEEHQDIKNTVHCMLTDKHIMAMDSNLKCDYLNTFSATLTLNNVFVTEKSVWSEQCLLILTKTGPKLATLETLWPNIISPGIK